MAGLQIKARTALALGVPSLARAFCYRIGVRTGLNPVRRLQAAIPDGPFFTTPIGDVSVKAVARDGWFFYTEAFGQRLHDLEDAPPNWLVGCFTGQSVQDEQRPWWQIADFDPAVGDIKTVWEFSRFDWVLACAQHAAKGDAQALERLNVWLANWLEHNPPYFGPNWKCGQEASIRIMHLAMASHALGQAKNTANGLLDVVELHLQRIAPTLMYAVAQNNNHGTSEAAALFIGGSWLAAHGRAAGKTYQAKGRKWLENRARLLIETDGSFSQYSVNYHRVMLDTLCMTEVWRRVQMLPPFSELFYSRAAAAADWLRLLTRKENGDVPNLGANDGARLLQLTDTDYRDFRPSVQLASVLFKSSRAYDDEGELNQPLYWLKQEIPQQLLHEQESTQLDKGGYFVLQRQSAMVFLRYPRFRYRPAQADALHIDFWLTGENWLRDAGSYSYNTDEPWLSYFPGTAAHNTVQLDGRDQMPRLGRFLLGAWLKAINLTGLHNNQSGALECGAGYRDWRGGYHERKLEMSENSLRVTDRVDGFADKAVLRWRLKPGNWQLDEQAQVLALDGFTIRFDSSVPVRRLELVEGAESRYYLHKTALPVLELEVDQPGELVTHIAWEQS